MAIKEHPFDFTLSEDVFLSPSYEIYFSRARAHQPDDKRGQFSIRNFYESRNTFFTTSLNSDRT